MSCLGSHSFNWFCKYFEDQLSDILSEHQAFILGLPKLWPSPNIAHDGSYPISNQLKHFLRITGWRAAKDKGQHFLPPTSTFPTIFFLWLTFSYLSLPFKDLLPTVFSLSFSSVPDIDKWLGQKLNTRNILIFKTTLTLTSLHADLSLTLTLRFSQFKIIDLNPTVLSQLWFWLQGWLKEPFPVASLLINKLSALCSSRHWNAVRLPRRSFLCLHWALELPARKVL